MERVRKRKRGRGTLARSSACSRVLVDWEGSRVGHLVLKEGREKGQRGVNDKKTKEREERTNPGTVRERERRSGVGQLGKQKKGERKNTRT